MKTCKTCIFFNSYYTIYDYDEFEPDDCGECHKGDYPYPSNQCGIGWDDTCEDWSPEE